jgi:hypothetical protein
VNVQFTVTAPDGAAGISERELGSRLAELSEAVSDDQPPDGLLLVEVPGRPVAEFADELWAAIQNVCFAAVPVLLDEGSPYVYRYSASDTRATLSPVGGQILVAGDDVPELSAPAGDLLVALYACGGRYLDLLDRLGRNAALRDHLGRYADRARGSLQRHGLLPPG